MWSVKEGQQQFQTESDDVTNFLRFWQSNNESKKTSIRVNEKYLQMAQDGLYRGGTAPFGYRLVKSGILNKKGKELMKFAIDYDKEEYRFIQVALNCKNKELQETYEEIDTLKKEVSKSILGKSEFKPKLLNEMIEQKEADIQRIDLEVRKLEEDLRTKKLELSDIRELAENIGIWFNKFNEASHEKRKMLAAMRSGVRAP